MVNRIELLILILLLFTLLDCSPETVLRAPGAKKAVEPAIIAEVKKGWEAEWEKILKEARKEGKVVIYTSAGRNLVVAMQKGFKDKYGLNVEFLAGRGEEITMKLKAERQAGLYLADLFIGGSTIPLVLMKPHALLENMDNLILLPEVKEPKVWWGGGMRWLDKDHTTLAFSSWALQPIVVHTNVIKTEEIKSYRDLLNPKLKGKIIIDDPSVSGSGAKVIGFMGVKAMGWDFIQELAKQEPLISRDPRSQLDWLSKGKHALAMGTKPEIVKEFREAGVPLEWVTPKEGTYLASGSGAISAYSNRPHRSVSRLFLNWLLTKEGQRIFAQAYGVPSARLDVPTSDFDPLILLKPGVEYLKSDEEEFVKVQPEHMKLAKEIFGIK